MVPTYITEQLLTTNLFVNASQVNRNIDNVIKGNLKVGKNNIDLSNYANGVYLLEISTNKGTATKRLIKQ